MLYSYAQCIKMFGTDKKLKKALKQKQIYKIEKGVYSDKEYESELAVISMKYPNAIFTLNSAFYYYGLTDVIPDLYGSIFCQLLKKLKKYVIRGLNKSMKIVMNLI